MKKKEKGKYHKLITELKIKIKINQIVKVSQLIIILN